MFSLAFSKLKYALNLHLICSAFLDALLLTIQTIDSSQIAPLEGAFSALNLFNFDAKLVPN